MPLCFDWCVVGHSASRIGQSEPMRTERASSKSKVQFAAAPPRKGSVESESDFSSKTANDSINCDLASQSNAHTLNFPLYIKSPFLQEKKEPIKLDISVKVVPKPRQKSDKKERKRHKERANEKEEDSPAVPMEE